MQQPQAAHQSPARPAVRSTDVQQGQQSAVAGFAPSSLHHGEECSNDGETLDPAQYATDLHMTRSCQDKPACPTCPDKTGRRSLELMPDAADHHSINYPGNGKDQATCQGSPETCAVPMPSNRHQLQPSATSRPGLPESSYQQRSACIQDADINARCHQDHIQSPDMESLSSRPGFLNPLTSRQPELQSQQGRLQDTQHTIPAGSSHAGHPANVAASPNLACAERFTVPYTSGITTLCWSV